MSQGYSSNTEDDSGLDGSGSNEDLNSITNFIDYNILHSDTLDLRTQITTGECRDLEKVTNRLYTLTENLARLPLDENSAEALKTNLTDVVRFSKAVISKNYHGFEENAYMKSLACIFDPKFFQCIFHLRQLLLAAAAGAVDSEQNNQGIACWIDLLLSLYSELISCVACTHGSPGISESLPDIFKEQRKHENIRVACQLPRSWGELPLQLVSKQVSPAVKRLCLHLLFAAYVLHPHITGYFSWNEYGIEPNQLLDCLQSLAMEFIDQARVLELSSKSTRNTNLKLSYPMLIGLFATTEYTTQGDSDSTFRPCTTTILSDIIETIFSQEENTSPFQLKEELDESALLLIRWGYTLPWAWSKWNDTRLIGFKTMVSMTAHWLCIDTFLTNEEDRNNNPTRMSENLKHEMKAFLKLNPQTALFSFYHQLDSIEACPLNTLRLLRATYNIRYIIHKSGEACEEAVKVAVVERLSLLFIGFINVDVNDDLPMIYELICCLQSMDLVAIKEGLTAFKKNTDFFSKMASITSDFLRRMNDSNMGTAFFSSLGYFLDFISLFCIAGLGRFLPASRFSLLSALVKQSYLQKAPTYFRISLLNCLSNVSAQCLDRSRSLNVLGKLTKTWEDEEAYNVALGISFVNIDLAVCLASYIRVSLEGCSDPLLAAEFWDFLRDALLLLTGHEYHQDDLLLSSRDEATFKIIEALEMILGHGNVISVQFLLNSPVTFSLLTSLRNLIASSNEEDGAERNKGSGCDTNWSSTTREACQRFLEKIGSSRLG